MTGAALVDALSGHGLDAFEWGDGQVEVTVAVSATVDPDGTVEVLIVTRDEGDDIVATQVVAVVPAADAPALIARLCARLAAGLAAALPYWVIAREARGDRLVYLVEGHPGDLDDGWYYNGIAWGFDLVGPYPDAERALDAIGAP